MFSKLTATWISWSAPGPWFGRTGADVFRGRHLDFAYGNTVAEGEICIFGSIQLTGAPGKSAWQKRS